VAGSRWAIGECFQTTKNETGLDHYQVRGYPGLVLAHHLVDGRGRLPDDRAPRRSKAGSPAGTRDLIPLTINEIRRLFNRVACPVEHALVHVWHWSNWRRASQARARASHYKRRHRKLSLQYFVAVIDCFSRKVVGWSIARSHAPCLDRSRAGERGLDDPDRAGAVFHSGRGRPVHLWRISAARGRIGNSILDGAYRGCAGTTVWPKVSSQR